MCVGWLFALIAPAPSVGSKPGEAPTEAFTVSIGCLEFACMYDVASRGKKGILISRHLLDAQQNTLGATVDMHMCNACQHTHRVNTHTAYGTLITDLFHMHHS